MIGYLLNIGLYAKCKGLGIIPKIAVCPDCGCAGYSLKSQYPQIVMSPLL